MPNDHTNKPYCLCKDSTIATGDPPQCNEDSAINQEQSGFLGSNIELPGGHPGLVLSPDMFAKNPGISESKGISPHKGVDLHPQIPSHMNFTGGNAEMQVRQLIQKNGHCPTKVICKGVNCGEAGCTCNLVTKQPQCICPDTGAPPDEFLKCPYRVINPINPSHKMKSPDTCMYNKTESFPQLNPVRSKNNGLKDYFHLNMYSRGIPLRASLLGISNKLKVKIKYNSYF